jgi:hypothetical protein
MVFALILGLDSFPEKPNEHAGYVSVLYSRLHIGSAQRFPEARRLTAEDIMRSICWPSWQATQNCGST